MNHIEEFSRFAASYDANTLIQKEVAKELTKKIRGTPQKILDLGCGSGAIYKNLGFTCKNFIGIDSSLQMCQIHPKNKNIILHNKNFEFLRNDEEIKKYENFDLIISSSALQWANPLENVLEFCKDHSKEILFALFTSNTFKSIFDFTGLSSPLPSSEKILSVIKKYYNINHYICEYKLHFDDNISKFHYIKKSGVSGGKKRLSVAQTKNLIKHYPYSYLEFEVIYIQNK